MTQKTPELRLEELHGTGVPTPFRLEYSVLVPNVFKAEKELHRHFKSERVFPRREFFWTTTEAVVQFIRSNLMVLHEEASSTSSPETQLEISPELQGDPSIPEELLKPWIPQHWRDAYLAVKLNCEELEAEIAELSGEKRFEAYPENPHPPPPPCGTPDEEEGKEREREDWRYSLGEISELDYQKLLKSREEADEQRRARLQPWVDFQKEKEAWEKKWRSPEDSLRTFKYRLELEKLKLKKFTNNQRLGTFRDAFEENGT